MAGTVDELTYDYTEPDGRQVRKELDKQVLTKGAWATVLFKFQELDRKKEEWGPEKAVIVRYRKRKGTYSKFKDFTITNAAQASRIVEILSGWFPPEESK